MKIWTFKESFLFVKHEKYFEINQNKKNRKLERNVKNIWK